MLQSKNSFSPEKFRPIFVATRGRATEFLHTTCMSCKENEKERAREQVSARVQYVNPGIRELRSLRGV